MNLDFLGGFDEPGYVMDVGRCARLSNVPAVITTVFRQIEEVGYVSVGDYLAGLSDMDLDILIDLSDRIHPEMSGQFSKDSQAHALGMLTLFALGLATGEGLHLDDDANEHYIKAIIVLIATEALARRGLIIPYRKNWTLGFDNMDKPIADARE